MKTSSFVRRASLLLVLPFLLLLVYAVAPPEDAADVPSEATYDLIIEGGKIVDGTGSAWFYGDVGIRGDRIAAVEPAGVLSDAQVRERRIDAEGMVVAPGFIDIQSHSRTTLLSGDQRVLSKITQGVTTEIMGEGWTNAPVSEKMRASGDVQDPDASEAMLERFSQPDGFGEWLKAMEERDPSVNVGSFLGASTARRYAMGMAEGAPSEDEIDTMRGVVRRAMEDGAFGIATALIYPPGNYATTDELVEMSEAMAPYGGVYITHMRSEADNILSAVDEAVEIGRRAGVPVEIYHLKAAGKRNWAKTEEVIEKIDAARADGYDVQANMYPYTAGGTGLSACLPPWASAGGNLMANLRDEEQRARMRREMGSTNTEWENLCQLATPENVMLLDLRKPENQKYIGQSLAEVAADQDKDWITTVMDLVESEEQRIGSMFFLMSEENVRKNMQQQWIKFGTDAPGLNPDSVEAPAHPRAYGTYPRILGKYVREEGVLPLEEAIRKMTSAVATRLSIQDRGLLREGKYADVVIFDPETIIDRATYEEPHQFARGIEHVFVNGRAVLQNGEPTDAGPGRIVYGPGHRPPGAGR